MLKKKRSMSFMTSYDKAMQNERYISENHSFNLHC